MKKDDLVKYWKKMSSDDWRRVNLLFKNREYLFALFCAHLSLEKLIKAHWIKDNTSNYPPKIHNLIYLIKATKLSITETEGIFLESMNQFQLEGRYPEYRNNLKKYYNKKNTEEVIANGNKIRKWLLKNR